MKYKLWIMATYVLQILTAFLHSLSFFSEHRASNDSEKPLVEAITTIKMDMGAGFDPTFAELFLSVSVALTLLCLFSGVMNWYLLKLDLDSKVYKTIMAINALTFGLYTVVNYFFAFLPPLVCIGLIFICSTMAYATNKN
jgi:hypothetical protein